MVDYLEFHDNEQTTIRNLCDIITEYLPAGVEPYTTRYMKSAIEDHFGDEIIFAEINGIPDVATFRETVSTIISEFYDSPKGNDCQAEKLRILRTAAKLIKVM